MKQLTRKEKALVAIGGNAADTIKNLSADTINNLSAYTINNLSADTIKNLSADTINNLSAGTINNLSAYTINNLSAYTINNLSADIIKNLSAYTINNLSAVTINKIKAIWDEVPMLENPYTTLLSDINTKKRIHSQSTFGDEVFIDDKSVCRMAMCTAGHFVQMGGKLGYKLMKKYGYSKAYELMAIKTHPTFPTQNTGSINKDLAIAFIEEMAECESTGKVPFSE